MYNVYNIENFLKGCDSQIFGYELIFLTLTYLSGVPLIFASVCRTAIWLRFLYFLESSVY